MATDSEFTSFVDGYNDLSVGLVTTWDAIGLSSAQTYYYRVRARNSGGTSGNSGTIAVMTLANPPSAPTALAANNVTATSFNANWTTSAGATNYFLDLATDSGFTSFVSGYNNLSVGDVTTKSVTGLSAGQTYYYQVRAQNSGGASASSGAITVRLPPAAPTAQAATDVSGTGFTAHWSASAGATNYLLDVATDSGFNSLVSGYDNLSVGEVTTKTLPGLTYGQTYYYRVRAQNGAGISDDSETISVVAIPPPTLGQVVLADGPIAWWRFNENGGATAFDVQAAHDGAYQGSYSLAQSGVSGDDGRAVYLNGGWYNYIRVPDHPALSQGPYSIEAIFKLNPANDWHVIFGKGASDSLEEYTFLIHVNGSWAVETHGPGGNYASGGVTGFDPNAWHHVVVTLSGGPGSSGAIVIYLDNTVIYSNASWTRSTENSLDLSIGARWIDVSSYAYNLLGWMDEFAIYNQVLSPARVAAHYNAMTVMSLESGPPGTRPANNVTPKSFSANWTPASRTTNYFLDVATDSGFTNYLAGYQNLSVGDVATKSVTGLGAEQTYYYRVRSQSSVGTSTNSGTISVTTLAIPPPPKPDYYWSFNEGSGTHLADSVGGNHGTLVNLEAGDWSVDTPSGVGSSLAFDGIEERVDLASQISFSSAQNFSVSFWYKGTDDGTTAGTFIGQCLIGWESGAIYANLTVLNGKVTYVHYPSSWVMTPQSTTRIDDNQWHHIIFVNHANATGDIYVDGVREASGVSTTISGTPYTIQRFMYGYPGSGAGAYAQGLLDEVGIYNTALTPDEVEVIRDNTPVIPAAPMAAAATNVAASGFYANWSVVYLLTNYYRDVATNYLLNVSTDSGFTSYVSGYQNLSVGDVTSYAVTGLSAGQTYYYQVRAQNSAGTSGNSGTIAVATLPPAPTALPATQVQGTGFRANWSGSANATNYLLDVAPNDTFSSFVSGYSNKTVGPGSFHIVSNLTLNTTYYYRLRAQNGGVISPVSGTISVRTPGLPVVTTPTASNLTAAGSVHLGATVSTNGGAVLLARGTVWGLSPNPVSNILAEGSSATGIFSHVRAGLPGGTLIYYRGYAENGAGRAYSADGTFTTIPAAPTGLVAAVVQTYQFTAVWTGMTGATSYRVDVSTSSDFSSFVPGYEDKLVSSGTSVEVLSLAAQTIYYVRVRSVNASGTSGNSSTIAVLTLEELTISGQVLNADTGEGVEGATVLFSGGMGSALSGSGGFYSRAVAYGWSGILTPSHTTEHGSGSFQPVTRTYSSLTASESSADFSWKPPPQPGNKYVSLTGLNQHPYTNWVMAARDIQTAVNAAINGDDIVVADGVYNLYDGITVDKRVTIRSLNGPQWTTVRRAGGWDGIFYVTTNATISGFTITNGYAAYSWHISSAADAGGVTLSWSGRVENCIIRGNTTALDGFAGGLSLANGSVAVNCLIEGNSASSSQSAGGVLMKNGARLINCTVVGNSKSGGYGNGGVYVYEAGDPVYVDNSIVWGNTYGYAGRSPNLYADTGSLNVRYSNYENAYNIQTPVASVTADPAFTSAAQRNYRLTSRSWGIGGGNDAYNDLDTDLDGNFRISGTIDMGCYEYDGTVIRVMGRVTHEDTGEAVSGVTVTLTGAGAAELTSAQGYYTFVVADGWSGSVNPSYPTGSFSPTVLNYGSTSSDRRDADFSWIPPNPVISGRVVRADNGAGVTGVVINLGSQGLVTSRVGGVYTKTVPRFYSATVSASSPIGGTFTPATRSYTDLIVDSSGQNYTWYPPQRGMSGRIVNHYTGAGVSGAEVSFTSGGGDTVTTDGNGYYSGSVFYEWSGRAVPSKSGGYFSPTVFREYTNLLTAQTDQDFTWVPYDPVISGKVTNTLTGAGVSGAVVTIGSAGAVTTSVDGSYAYTVPHGWDGTVAVERAPMGTVTPASRTYADLIAASGSQDYGWTPPDRSIAGTITHADTSAGLDGVTVSFSGWGETATTAGGGAYSETLYYGWSGTITPSYAGGTFVPASISTTLDTAQTGRNFVFYPNRTISGRITNLDTGAGIDGITVTFTGGEINQTVATAGGGYFSYAVPHGWSGTVSLSSAGAGYYTPASRSYNNVATDTGAQNFVWNPNRTIAGRITNGDTGAGIDGLAVAVSGGAPVTTAGGGYYTATVAHGWTGTIAPANATGSFSPENRSYSSVSANLTGQNYVWYPPWTISGRLVNSYNEQGISGAIVSAPGAPWATSDANGYYEITVPKNWSGRVTPAYGSAAISPAYRDYPTVVADYVYQDYLVTPADPVVSGRVTNRMTGFGVPGVTITFSDGQGSAVTDGNGNYSLTVDWGWGGSIVPSYGMGALSPGLRNTGAVQADLGGQDFSWTPPALTIAGTVTNLDAGAGIAGAQISIAQTGSNTLTDAQGRYTLTAYYGFTGTVVASLSGGTMSPPSYAYNGLTNNQTGGHYIWSANRTISGRVTNQVTGAGLDGVTLSTTGLTPVVTAGGGYYSLEVTNGWSGRMDLAYSTGAFVPAYRTYTAVTADRTAQNYSWIPYRLLSGRIVHSYDGSGVDGARVDFSAGGGSAYTTNGGYYSKTMNDGWSGRATPTYTNGGTFVAAYRDYAALTEDAGDQDYQWTPPSPNVGGTVRNGATGRGVPGVTVTLGGAGSALTAADGSFSQAVPYGWSGSITAAYTNYSGSLAPASRSLIQVFAHTGGQDFTWTGDARTVSGVVTNRVTGEPVGGVVLTPQYLAAVTTAVDGTYAASVYHGWSGTLTPSATGGVLFAPSSRAIAPVEASLSGMNFSYLPRLNVNGRITDPTGAGVDGIQVRSNNGGTTNTTAGGGYYGLTVPWNWTGAVTPVAPPDSMMAPASRSFTAVQANQANVDFVVQGDVLISGRVTDFYSGGGVDGVAIQLTNGASTVTAGGGFYTVQVAYAWSGRITASRSGGTVQQPSYRDYASVTEDQTAQDYVWKIADPLISGQVTHQYTGAGLAGVVVTVSGVGSASTTAGGNYSIGVPYGWSGTISITNPATSGTPVPASRSYTDVRGNTSAQNFVWAPTPRTISGVMTNALTQAPVSGHALAVSGMPGATTDASGAYAAQVYEGWTGTITPAAGSGYVIVPASRTYTAVASSLAGEDFNYLPSVVISGRITHYYDTGTGVDGVTLSFPNGGGTAQTATGGYYRAQVPYGWSGRVTPVHPSGGTFPSPAYRDFAALSADAGDQDFVWRPADPVISGWVRNHFSGAAVSGAILTPSSGSAVQTDGAGAYALSVPYAWTGTVTASYSSGTIVEPATLSYSNLTVNQPNRNYSWIGENPVISGRVVNWLTSNGVDGVTLNFSNDGGSTVTTNGGYYSRTVTNWWGGYVSPGYGSATSAPVYRYFAHVGADLAGQDFVLWDARVEGNRYVSKTGSSVYPFTTWATAATNPLWAVSVAGAGERVFVSNGIYRLPATLAVTNPIRVTGVNGAAMTVFEGDGVADFPLLSLAHANAEVSGLTLRNGRTTNWYGVVQVQRGYLYNTIIRDNVGLHVSGVAGAYLGDPTSARMANCLLVNNTSPLAGWGALYGGGTVVNCTFANNTPTRIYAASLFNSIVEGDVSGDTLSYTLAPSLLDGVGNLQGDPQYTNPNAGDYTLQSTSPAKDQGRDFYNVLPTDLGGAPRIFRVIDMGAYETAPLGGLAVSLGASPSPVPQNNVITYLLNGYNGGPNPAQGVVVTNLLPPEVTYLSNSVNAAYTAGKLVWPIGNLALDQTATAQIWVRAGVAGSITSRAAIAASVADAGEPGYDQAVCITRVLGPVAITNVSATTLSNVSTVEWNTVVGVGYDIYMHDGTFTDKPSWGEREGTMLASENLRHFLDESAASTVDARFYQVTFADNTPSPSNIWGLIRREARPGFTLMAPPLITDRRFDGELGRMLAEQLQGNDGGMGAGGDEIYISNGGTGWRMLYLDAGKVWREANGDPCVYELPAGVGFWVARKSGTGVRITFTGQVGNEGTRTATLQPGFNLISLSEGKALPLKATFATANPVGADVEDAADQIVIQKANGSWRKLMYIQGWGAPYDGNWFDLTTFQIVPENEVLEPGAAYYYFRNGAATDVEF